MTKLRRSAGEDHRRRPKLARSGALILVAFSSAIISQVAPRIVYGTYLGGSFKECSTGLAVDSSGNAYVTGHTPSPDFPVTAGAFSTKTNVNNNDWVGFLSKISPRGDRLVYSSFIGGEFRSSANAVAVDAAGRAFVAGSTCSSHLTTTPNAAIRKAPGSDKVDACDGFVAWLNVDGSRLEYESYLGGSKEDAVYALAVDEVRQIVYAGGFTSSPDFPVAGQAIQRQLNGSRNGFLSAVDMRSGKLLYSTYLGGNGSDVVTGIAVSADGTVYVSGTTDSKIWPHVRLRPVGKLGAADGFVVRIDPLGKVRPAGIRIGGSEEESLSAIALDSNGGIYVAGTTSSRDFPALPDDRSHFGGDFVVKMSAARFASARPGVIWMKRFGGHREDALLSISAGMPGTVFVAGRSSSKDFPTTSGAFFPRLEGGNDSTLVRLRASDGQIQFATFVGGTRLDASWYNDEARGVVAEPNGDVFVAGCTLDNRLPGTANAFQPRPKGNSEPFVLRLSFADRNR